MITFESLSFRYPSADRDAIDGLSFEAAPGVTLLVGPEGAGTSTVLLVAAGLAPAETGGQASGQVRVLDHDPTTNAGRRELAGRIGYLQPSPWTQLSGMTFSAVDEVSFAAANLGWERQRILDAAQRALTSVDAKHLADRHPSSLSGGELQRVMLAAALATDPEVLLLDNPTSELDSVGTRRFLDVLASLPDSVTVLIASTDVDRAADAADRVILMDGGTVVAQGDASILASEDAFARDCLTTPALIGARSGALHPFPLTLTELVERVPSR